VCCAGGACSTRDCCPVDENDPKSRSPGCKRETRAPAISKQVAPASHGRAVRWSVPPRRAALSGSAVAHVGRGSGNAEWLWAAALRTLRPARLRDLAAPVTEKHLGSAIISREGGSGTHWLLTAESRRACSAPASARGAKDGAESGEVEERLIPSRPPGLAAGLAADPAYSSGDSSGSRPPPAGASLRRLSPHFSQCGPARRQGRGMAGAHHGDPCRGASRGLRRGEQARPLRYPLSAWRGLRPDDAPPPQRLPTRAHWGVQRRLRGARTTLVASSRSPCWVLNRAQKVELDPQCSRLGKPVAALCAASTAESSLAIDAAVRSGDRGST